MARNGRGIDPRANFAKLGGMCPSAEPESPLTDDAARLIQGSQAAMEAAFAQDEILTFSASELVAVGAQFYIARDRGQALGCVACVDAPGYAEVKRLYVAPEGRRLGLARLMMTQLEADATRRGIPVVRLETGPALEAAVALYRALGYVECKAFGGYPDVPSNMFMEKRLALPAGGTREKETP